MKSFFKKSVSVIVILSVMLTLASTVGCGSYSYLENAFDAATGVDSSTGNWNGGTQSGGKNGYEGRADFIYEIGGVSETYTGAVSETSYYSATEAAAAYVTEEVVGDNYVSDVSYTSSRTLSHDEIVNLGLPDDAMHGITTVEEMVVEYTLGNDYGLYAGDVPVTPLSTNTFGTTPKHHVVVYAIKYEMDWKYFTPPPSRAIPSQRAITIPCSTRNAIGIARSTAPLRSRRLCPVWMAVNRSTWTSV